MIRLNKYISDSGYCSRREADRLIEAGKVCVDENVATLGMQLQEAAVVKVEGKVIHLQDKKVYLAFYKPKGIVCTYEKREKNNLTKVFDYPMRVTYAGRLDKDSEGLLIMTNDGTMIDQMMRARNYHEKEYIVKVNKDITKKFILQMAKGVYIDALEQTTRPAKVMQSGEREFHIILTQGLNRQIRRMCDKFNYQVLFLKRIRIVNVLLSGLAPGEYRDIEKEELEKLKSSISSS